MKSLAQFVACASLFAMFTVPVHAAFSSLYVFGDGVSTTTSNNTTQTSLYYGKRYCNGRVWVEVVAQWQGLNYESNKNLSYFGHYSPNLVTNVHNFVPSGDMGTALFVVWVNNADFVYNMQNYAPYNNTRLAAWTNALNQSVTNHLKVITNLYAKGARTLILPNAVDISKITPAYPGLTAADKSFIRQRTIEFNANFGLALSNAAASFAGLRILMPDSFRLLDDVLAQPSSYGFTNSTGSAILAGYTSFTGPGTNYVFWDYLHPTAKMQMYIADLAQQLLSPTAIANITCLGDSNRLDAVNLPIGRDGIVLGSSNCANWSGELNFASTNLAQSLFVPTTGPLRFYRLRFPFVWIWP